MRRPAAALQPEQEHGVTASYQSSEAWIGEQLPASLGRDARDERMRPLSWPASLSRNPDVVAAALAAVDAAPLADVRGTFWPDTSEITLLEAAVLSGHAKTRRDTRRLCLDSVLVFADVRRKKRTSWGCSWRSLLMERCCHVLGACFRKKPSHLLAEQSRASWKQRLTSGSHALRLSKIVSCFSHLASRRRDELHAERRAEVQAPPPQPLCLPLLPAVEARLAQILDSPEFARIGSWSQRLRLLTALLNHAQPAQSATFLSVGNSAIPSPCLCPRSMWKKSVRVCHRRRSPRIAQSVRSSRRRRSLDESERLADAFAEKLLTDGGDIGDDEALAQGVSPQGRGFEPHS